MKKYIVSGAVANDKLAINQTTVSATGNGIDLMLSVTQDYSDKLLSVMFLFPNNLVWKSFPTAVSNNVVHVAFDAGSSNDFNVTGNVIVSAEVLNSNGILTANIVADQDSAFQITEMTQNLTMSNRSAMISDPPMSLNEAKEKEELLKLIAQVRHDLESGSYKGDKGDLGVKGLRGDSAVINWGFGTEEPPVSSVFWDEVL